MIDSFFMPTDELVGWCRKCLLKNRIRERPTLGTRHIHFFLHLSICIIERASERLASSSWCAKLFASSRWSYFFSSSLVRFPFFFASSSPRARVRHFSNRRRRREKSGSLTKMRALFNTHDRLVRAARLD